MSQTLESMIKARDALEEYYNPDAPVVAMLSHAITDVEGYERAYELLFKECGELKAQITRPGSIDQEKQNAEFEAITRPVIEWLNANFHPHTTIVIDPTSAVLSEGTIAYTTHDYVRD